MRWPSEYDKVAWEYAGVKVEIDSLTMLLSCES
jgi:hypothetical protein